MAPRNSNRSQLAYLVLEYKYPDTYLSSEIKHTTFQVIIVRDIIVVGKIYTHSSIR